MKRCAISLATCFCLLSMTAVAWTNDAQKAVVGTHEIMTIDVPSDVTWDKPVFVQGVLRKTGSGKLTLPAEKLYGQGCIEVADGELDVTATGAGSDAVAEPAILNGAAMWLDASRHVAGADGAAATDYAAMWYDVREENWATAGGFSTNYIYAQGMANLATDGLLPAYGIDGNGRKFIDFGGYKSGQYMVWRKPSGDKAWIPIANSFVAYSPNGSHGHYLGVATDYSVDKNKVMYFAVSTGGDGTTFFANESHARYRHLRFGHVFCNGVAVDPYDTIDKTATQLLETESYPVEGYAEAFFNFRNYQASAGSGSASVGNRVGGGRLHEVLIFTNRITEIDRVLVEQYLLRKWVKSSGYATLPKFRVMSGATLTLDGRLEVSVQSEGVLRHTGSQLSLATEDVFAGIGGTVVIDANATVSNRFGAAIAPQAGKEYAVDGWNTVSISDGTAGTISKTGTGTLALAGLGSAATLAVADGQAAVRAVATNAAVTLSGNCLADGGFEGIYTGTSIQNYSTDTSMGAWTATNYCSSGNTRLCYKTGWTPLWKDSGADPQYVLGTPEGSYYLLLKNGGGVKQSVTLPKAGRYEVTMRAYPRSDGLMKYTGFARLYMDDVLIGTAQSPAQQLDWDYIRFETPWLEAGPHVFRIASEVTVDLAIAIDDVRLQWLDDMPAVAALKNGNFEDADWEAGSSALIPSVAVSTAISTTIQTNTALPSTFLTGWTADGTVTLLRGRPYFRTSNFAAPLTGTGSICAFLQTGASVRQTVTIPEDGLYVLSAAAANYATSGLGNPTGNSDGGYTSGKIQLTLGETSETISFGAWSLRRKRMSLPVRLSQGDSVEVAITAPATTDSGRNNILVDDVRLERVTDNRIVNPGFEGGGGAKAPTGWTVVANPLDKQILYTPQDVYVAYVGDEMAEGTHRARLHAGTHLAQTLTLDPGLYRLSFYEVSRTLRHGVGSPWIVGFGPSPICVTFARGTTTNFCATVTPSSTRTKFMRREYLVKVEDAGEWTLGFEATASTNDDLSSYIDAVCLAPVRDMPDTAVPSAAPDVSLEVAAGASLALDWPGVFTCGRLRCAGTSFVGDISSATAPDSLFGIGRLSITPKGTLIMFR